VSIIFCGGGDYQYACPKDDRKNDGPHFFILLVIFQIHIKRLPNTGNMLNTAIFATNKNKL